jgi:regulation of enolase protein 1 (concanavalin A-like superfamily)
MKRPNQTVTAFTAAVLLWRAVASAAIYADNFDTSHNYLTDGVAGTIWDGFSYNFGGHGDAIVTVADAGAAHAGRLTLISANGGWEETRDDGVLLYRTVGGDFDARIHITSMNISYHDAGLMARAAPVDAQHESYVAVRYFADLNFNSTRNTVNGKGVGNIDVPGAAQPWLRLTRVGDTFTSWRGADGRTWCEMTRLTRLDLSGLSLQVGIWQGTFSPMRGIALFDHFTLLHGRSTTTVLTISPSPSPAGSNPTLTATVQTNGVAVANAQGSVVFKVDGISSSTNVVSGGLAILSQGSLAPGSHTISAEYSGDSLYQPSTSTPVDLVWRQPFSGKTP